MIRALQRSRACSARHPTGWVHVTRPAAATATGSERCNLCKVADTPSPGFAVLSGRHEPPTLDDIPSTRGTRQMGVNGSTDRHPAIGGQALSECRPLRGRPRAGRVDFPSMSALARALHAGLLERVDRHPRVEGGRVMRARQWSRACSARHPTGWVHVTRPAAATATGRERCNL